MTAGRILVIVVLAMLLVAVPARGDITGDPYLRDLAHLAAVPKPDAQLLFESCPVNRGRSDGCAIGERVFVEPIPAHLADQLPDEDAERVLRATLYHELGHAFADQRMRHGHWQRFRRFTRMTRRWHTVELVGERFADAYANCAFEALPGSWRFVNGYGYEPSRPVHRRVCALIRRAATQPD